MAKKDFGSVAGIISNAANKAVNGIPEMDINKIVPNENNFFNMEQDAEYQLLVESIRENGVLHPVVLIKVADNQYKIISGERRYRASIEAGKKTIPYSVLPDGVDAEVALIDTNFCARSLSVSDFAKAIDFLENKLKKDANLKGKTRDHIGAILGISGKQVQRYKSYNNLAPELKEKVDNNEIGMSTAAQLASLPEEKQVEAVQKIEESEVKVTREDIKEIKEKLEPKPQKAREKTDNSSVNESEKALHKNIIELKKILQSKEKTTATEIINKVSAFILAEITSLVNEEN